MNLNSPGEAFVPPIILVSLFFNDDSDSDSPEMWKNKLVDFGYYHKEHLFVCNIDFWFFSPTKKLKTNIQKKLNFKTII